MRGCFKGNLWLIEPKEIVFTEYRKKKSYEIVRHNVGKFVKYEDIHVLEETSIVPEL